MFSEHPRHKIANSKCYRTFDLQRHCIPCVPRLVSNLVLPADELVCWSFVPEKVVTNGRSQAHIMLSEGIKCLREVLQMLCPNARSEISERAFGQSGKKIACAPVVASFFGRCW